MNGKIYDLFLFNNTTSSSTWSGQGYTTTEHVACGYAIVWPRIEVVQSLVEVTSPDLI